MKLCRAKFKNLGGKGSHRYFHKDGVTVVIIGNLGADAKHYQERDAKRAVTETST